MQPSSDATQCTFLFPYWTRTHQCRWLGNPCSRSSQLYMFHCRSLGKVAYFPPQIFDLGYKGTYASPTICPTLPGSTSLGFKIQEYSISLAACWFVISIALALGHHSMLSHLHPPCHKWVAHWFWYSRRCFGWVPPSSSPRRGWQYGHSQYIRYHLALANVLPCCQAVLALIQPCPSKLAPLVSGWVVINSWPWYGRCWHWFYELRLHSETTL